LLLLYFAVASLQHCNCDAVLVACGANVAHTHSRSLKRFGVGVGTFQVLSKVELLNDLDSFERSQVADALESEDYEAGGSTAFLLQRQIAFPDFWRAILVRWCALLGQLFLVATQ
jgi:hypothetical protein